MKHQNALQRIDLNEIPFRASLPLIRLDQIEKLILKKLESRSDKSEFSLDSLPDFVDAGSKIGPSISLGAYGGLIGLAVYLLAIGSIKIANIAHKNVINNSLNEGIDGGINNVKGRQYDRAIASIKHALDQVDKYTSLKGCGLFKLGKAQNERIKEIKVLLKYNLAVAYYQAYISHAHKDDHVRRQDLDDAILWMIQTGNDIRSLACRPNVNVENCLHDLELHKAILENNDGCDAFDAGDLSQARSHFLGAIRESREVGFALRPLEGHRPEQVDPNAAEIRRVIIANKEAVDQAIAHQEVHRVAP